MNTEAIIILVVVIVLLCGGVWYWRGKPLGASPSPSSPPSAGWLSIFALIGLIVVVIVIVKTILRLG